MNTKTATAQNCSLFEIGAELEETFDQLQEERAITGTISNESRERSVQLFAELGKKIDRVAAYLRTQQRKASIAAEEAQRLQQRRRSAEQRVDDVKQMLTYFMCCRGLKRLEGEQGSGLFPAAQNSGHHTWTAASVKHSNHEERLFVRRIGNKVVAHNVKPQGARGQVIPPVALARERDKLTDGVENLLADAACGERIVDCPWR